jgi:hypothetical protein
MLYGWYVVEISMDYKDIYICPSDNGISVPKCFHKVRIPVHKTLVSG